MNNRSPLPGKHNRKIQDQIRELIKLGIEKAQEDAAGQPYGKAKLEKVVAALVKEQFREQYEQQAKEGPPTKRRGNSNH